MRRRMLYIMGVSWYWIYQRPQILAEKLSDDLDVTVVYPYRLGGKNRKARDTDRLRFRRVVHIPFQERTEIAERLFIMLNSACAFKDIECFDYIYIGHPVYARLIPEGYEGKIIYDCMDNYEAMCGYASYADNVKRFQTLLAKRCDLLLVTSELLREKMDLIVGYRKSVLCRNGTDVSLYPIKPPVMRKEYSIGYIGTIAEWFDFELLAITERELPDIKYRLIGPADGMSERSNIRFEGTVPHQNLYDYIKDYDCLIMPFILNDITLSVDPVKLYEYIAFGKCIVSVYYPEIERFRDFVYFYHNTKEYADLIKELSRKGFPVKFSDEQRRHFLAGNTWDHRAAEIRKNIREMQE